MLRAKIYNFLYSINVKMDNKILIAKDQICLWKSLTKMYQNIIIWGIRNLFVTMDKWMCRFNVFVQITQIIDYHNSNVLK